MKSELVVEGSTTFWIGRIMLALVILWLFGEWHLLSQRAHLASPLLKNDKKQNKTWLIWQRLLKNKQTNKHKLLKLCSFFLWEKRESPNQGTWFLIALYYPLY